MKFGAAVMFRNPQPWRRPVENVYEDILNLCMQAEDLGLDE
jgi:hypothetical protein